MNADITLEVLQIIGMLTVVAGLTYLVVKLVQKLERFLNKKDLVKDAIRKAKIEFKERNK